MNLSEALNAALPETPKTRYARERPPRLDPELIIHEDTLDGEPIIGVLQREGSNYFRFPPGQWRLAELFDGVRSYEEIAALFKRRLVRSSRPMTSESSWETWKRLGSGTKRRKRRTLLSVKS